MNIMENMKATRNVDMVNSNGPAGIRTRDSIKMMRDMVMEKWHGLMEVSTLESGARAYSTVMAK